MSRILIPPQYQGCTFFDFDEAQQRVVKAWLDAENPGLLTLYGPVGTGKTRCLYAIYAQASTPACHVEFWTVSSLVRRLQSLQACDCRWKYDDFLNIICGRPGESEYEREERKWRCGSIPVNMLLLDDFGTEKRTEFVLAAVQEILDLREKWGLPTAISTNLTMNQIKVAWGDRIASRLNGGKMVKFTGKDRRGK